MKIILFFFIISSFILSGEINEYKTDLYYANGIMMKESEANALHKWKSKFNYLLINNKTYDKVSDIKISYNVSQGFLDDLLESFEQVTTNEWDWQKFTAYYTIFLETSGIQEDWRPHFNNLNTHVDNYKNSIKNGHNVIIISHSQGNYFTNEAYELLDNWMKPYFKMMGVATPANHVAGYLPSDNTAPYVKFHNDFIKLVVTGLSSNLENPNKNHNSIISVAAHDFYDSYLTSPNSKKIIFDFIESEINKHSTAPTQWKTNEEFNYQTCAYEITVIHKFDSSIKMEERILPFNASKKLYKVKDQWVKGSYGGIEIKDTWDTQKYNECLLLSDINETILNYEFPGKIHITVNMLNLDPNKGIILTIARNPIDGIEYSNKQIVNKDNPTFTYTFDNLYYGKYTLFVSPESESTFYESKQIELNEINQTQNIIFNVDQKYLEPISEFTYNMIDNTTWEITNITDENKTQIPFIVEFEPTNIVINTSEDTGFHNTDIWRIVEGNLQIAFELFPGVELYYVEHTIFDIKDGCFLVNMIQSNTIRNEKYKMCK